ncbi:BREX-1 system adenine-specific DNA-methyltransferase PglX [Sphingobacterium cellulitidis]|uniref:BREX-1 system adenine-specific DNA-methyltransferase PglX n=1 Tax=Sphingobacterium cellulitidis TaxID=1768011 RepID=UPI000B9456FD|nr:hypothetical protein CHT99_08535 [Sphingobacterium cellulitidis]
MNTNKLKFFAKAARIQLLDTVSNQILYWGFSTKREVLEEPQAMQGGFMHRSEVYNDSTVVPKWNRLKEKITANKEAFKDVAEEAAYTWFNRLVAIKVLEENGFIEPFLQFAKGSQTPVALQNAKAGNHAVTHSVLKANLQAALLASQEEKAFHILLINFCNQHPLLREIFGQVNDYTELLIPHNLLAPDCILKALNDEEQISATDFTEVELIGWLYQFYISDKKDEVFRGFKANKKARPEDIPAATQIFTPKWIVNYMVENTVGKIYLDFEEDSDLKYQMKYLVQNETDGKGALIDDIEQLTLIDPACGSGHILVTGFEWLYKMYREQGYSAKNAIESILKHNLFGLDIDDRAMQLARFAVLLKAAQQLQQVDASQAIALMNNPVEVIPHIYAFPEKRSFPSESVAIFTRNQQVAEVCKAFEQLRDGKNIGSALKIELSDAAREILIEQYYDWNTKAKQGTLDIEEVGVWQQLKNYVEVALVLSKKYAAVVANPPYMGQKSMNAQLKEYVNKHYPMTKADLFAVFMEVTLNLTHREGLMGMINQHSWMFLSSFEKYREQILNHTIIQSMLHLGPRTFEELSGEVVQSTAFVFENSTPKDAKGSYYRLLDYKSNSEKEEQFLKKNNFYSNIPQTNFDKIPGSPIAYWVSEKVREIFNDKSIESYAKCRKGLTTSDDNSFIRNWYEINFIKFGYYELMKKWVPIIKGGGYRKWSGNFNNVINWENNGQDLKSFNKSYLRAEEHYGKELLTWNAVSAKSFTGRYVQKGFIFNDVGPSIADSINPYILLGWLNSIVANEIFKILCPTMKFEVGMLQIFPFSISNDINIELLSKLNVSLSKKDWDSRETSWDFETNPLLGIREKRLGKSSLRDSYEAWKAKVSQDFFQLHANEEELNRIFIDIYGLQEELTPEVLLADITILQDELVARRQKTKKKKGEDEESLEEAKLSPIWKELENQFRKGQEVSLPFADDIVMQQLLSYLVGTMLGRYRLDQPGLHIAHPNPTEEELSDYVVENAALPFQMAIDEDAIIPLMGSACAFPDDAVKRVDELLHRMWGDESHTENLNFLNQALGMPYEKWMCEQFWAYHISGTMYKKKPIYWLFCSNPKSPQKSAFRVLVYMHRMDAYTVQKILRNYLHPHIEYVKGQYEEMHNNEANLSKQELKVYENMAKQISELKTYEQVLKDLANQQITFDLDDGVTVNYAKFEGAVAVIK